VEIRGDNDDLLILDAGTGIRRLGAMLPNEPRRVDILLTHLHLDHLQGLGFFKPLRIPGFEVHIWGPASTTQSLAQRLTRYLSPPLFPVRLRDLPCDLFLHEVPGPTFDVGRYRVDASFIVHPGPTVGFRIEGPGGTVAYMPDHEPALGDRDFPGRPEWTSGFRVAREADLLIHDGQYTHEEYATRVGWGHSTLDHTFDFATMAGVRRLVPFHHDPSRSDDALEREIAAAVARKKPAFPVTPAAEGQSIVLEE
jgi:phosphoribosyl 1,2-cyclic phosphodiesterase